ncbi:MULTISPECIES: thiol reductant ABC exporter subunit CydD [unclassified Variovorax]|uniref:thiol reductant ABC exporter subunit CydD n=1 Tax=unclassified Variovorax TaxID=663243 RepID=UPI00076D380F|nr:MULTISPECIES: thiol reductant ABC exporter subunit CydD [unclassified Variovorax]KWT74150.1 Transport ATP-binding protein CydD [Variovorax sp. WDL1]PNG52163.1 ATP-binding/permease protein CydD [Variovorax sp. B4]PNG54703.1 ATP-binding/permease protein CydD [Variovorax sp. B2]VTV15692.1 ATP-binding/permease protein CydD [Variovorax sp. WDL1]
MNSPASSSSLKRLPPMPRVAGLVQGGAALLWLPQAALLAWAVDGLARGEGMPAVLWPALGIVLLGLMRALCEAWGMRRVFSAARAALSALRTQAAAALAAHSPLDRARPASGLAASAIAEQAEAVVPYLVRYAPARWRAAVVPLLILPLVALYSWVAAVILLVAAPLIPLFMAIVGWQARAASEAHMVEAGGMHAFLLDRLRGLASLRALGAIDATALRLGEAAQGLRRRTMAVLRIAFLSSAVLELFSALGVAMVAAYVGFHLLGTFEFGTWGRRLSLGEGLFVLLLAPAFFEPLRELSAVWHDRAAGEAALAALDRLEHGETELLGANVGLPGEGRGAAEGPPSVRLRGVRLAHAGGGTVFEGRDLRVAAGEHVALMGASGSGKTALLSLIAGLLPARQGQVVVGGVLLSDRTATALRRRMAWMGQKPHVFAGSVEANVALGRDGVQPAQVGAAMRFAALDAVAQAHPRASLGEGGRGLSGGEAARLALARLAVNADADLLLVDEPTAHLDTATAAHVAESLIALAQGKTLIVATHDPVLAARMDRVVSLDDVPVQEAA